MSVIISLFADEHQRLSIDECLVWSTHSSSCVYKYVNLRKSKFFFVFCYTSMITFLLFVSVVRQPWYWEGLIFQTIFRVGEIALIFLGIRLLGAGSLLLEVSSNSVIQNFQFF
jgi:hypothetical protein